MSQPSTTEPLQRPIPERARRAGAAAAWLSALVLLCSTAGCSGEKETPPPEGPRAGGDLRVLHEFPRNLDPLLVDDVYEGTITNQIYEGLVRVDKNLTPVPALAESWVIAEDGRVYRFQLREGVTFHNGDVLDARAVAHAFHRPLHPDEERFCLAETYLEHILGAREYRAGEAESIEGIRILGSHELEIELDEPLSFFLAVLSMDQTRIVPPDSTALGRIEEQPIGTGPFRFGARLRDDTVVLRKNHDYWGEPALIDSLVFRCFEDVDDEQTAALLGSGEVDVALIASHQHDRLKQELGLNVTEYPELAVTFIGMNTKQPPLDQVQVRQAIAHAIDRDSFLRLFEDETDLISATGILPPGMPGYLPNDKVPGFDLARARELLAEAGYGPENPTPIIRFATSTSGRTKTWIEEVIQPSLAEIGVTIEVDPIGWSELDSQLSEGTTHVFTLAWIADVPDPDGFLYHLFRSGETNNLFGFSDVEVDLRLATARMLPSGEERLATYRSVERRVLELAPMIPLFFERTFYAWNPAVRGVEMSPFGLSLVNFSKVWLTEGGHPAQLAGSER